MNEYQWRAAWEAHPVCSAGKAAWGSGNRVAEVAEIRKVLRMRSLAGSGARVYRNPSTSMIALLRTSYCM